MKRYAESGWKGTTSFMIINSDDAEYNASVRTQDKLFETTCSCWEAARKWVDNKIIDIEEMGHEAGRDY